MVQMGMAFMGAIMGIMDIMAIMGIILKLQSIIRAMAHKMGTSLDMPQTLEEVFQGYTGKWRPCRRVVEVLTEGGEIIETVLHKLMKEKVQIAGVRKTIEVLEEMSDIHQEKKNLDTEQIADWIVGQLLQGKFQ